MCLSLFLMKLKPVSNSLVIFSNSLSFHLFIFWNHIAFPWLSMTFTWIPWISRPGNWNHKFYDFPGFPWLEWTLKRDTSYPEEVHLWLKHLEDMACNRKWGAKKAAAKRREGWTLPPPPRNLLRDSELYPLRKVNCLHPGMEAQSADTISPTEFLKFN